jgi:hypothetical protein
MPILSNKLILKVTSEFSIGFKVKAQGAVQPEEYLSYFED